MPDSNTTTILDRKFVMAAIAIAIMYALIVACVYMLISKEMANTVGTMLGLLGTGILQKFEGLQFKASPSTTIEIPTLQVWTLTLLIFCYMGAEFLFGLIIGLIFSMFGLISNFDLDPGRIFDLFLNPVFIISILGAKFLAYFIVAYCTGRVIVNIRYSQSLIVGACALICSMFLPILPFLSTLIKNPGMSISDLINLPQTGVFSIAYLAAVLLGVMLAKKHTSERSLIDG